MPEGVTISLMNGSLISDRKLVKEFRALARRKKIKHQLEVLPRGGTDAEVAVAIVGGGMVGATGSPAGMLVGGIAAYLNELRKVWGDVTSVLDAVGKTIETGDQRYVLEAIGAANDVVLKACLDLDMAYRPVGEAVQFHEKVANLDVPAELIIFADEGHGVRKRPR